MERLGLSYARPACHLREYVEVTRTLLHGGRVDHSGAEYQIATELPAARVPAPPILLAALGPRMLALAGKCADGVVTWMVRPRTLASHVATTVREAAEAAGRGPPRIIVGVPVAVTDDAHASRSRPASLDTGA